MNYEMLTLYIIIGMFISVILIGLGVSYGKYGGESDYKDVLDEEEEEDITSKEEEVISGLQTVRMGLTRQEKEYLDYAVDCVYRIGQLKQMIAERSK